MYMPAPHDARSNYLTGLLSRGRLGRDYNSRQNYLSGPYNSRASYLNGLLSKNWASGRRGLGQDDGGDPLYTPALYEDDPLYTPALYSTDPNNPLIGEELSTSDIVSSSNPPTTGFSINPSSVNITPQTAATIAQAAGMTAAQLAAASASGMSPYQIGATYSGIPWLSQSNIVAGMSNGTVLAIFGVGILGLSLLKKR